MMFGEAVVVFNKELSKHIAYKTKQVIQLASNPFYCCHFEAMLQNEQWRKPATHANNMAGLLCKALPEMPMLLLPNRYRPMLYLQKYPVAGMSHYRSIFRFMFGKTYS
jgi:threonine aldolase